MVIWCNCCYIGYIGCSSSQVSEYYDSIVYDYSFFPDEIPSEATNVSWIVCPSLMQGSGYEYGDIDHTGYLLPRNRRFSRLLK